MLDSGGGDGKGPTGSSEGSHFVGGTPGPIPDPVEGAVGSPIPSRPPQAAGFLLSQLGFETSARFAKLMAEVELEPRQFALMRAIEAFDGQPQNSVGEWLRIPPSSMVAVIDHLESRGLVERRLHPTDRRSRTLHMTPLGTDVLKRATELAMGLEQTICNGFDEDRRSELIAMLVRVADNLGLVQGLHPGTSTSHGSQHWTDNQPA